MNHQQFQKEYEPPASGVPGRRGGLHGDDRLSAPVAARYNAWDELMVCMIYLGLIYIYILYCIYTDISFYMYVCMYLSIYLSIYLST